MYVFPLGGGYINVGRKSLSSIVTYVLMVEFFVQKDCNLHLNFTW